MSRNPCLRRVGHRTRYYQLQEWWSPEVAASRRSLSVSRGLRGQRCYSVLSHLSSCIENIKFRSLLFERLRLRGVKYIYATINIYTIDRLYSLSYSSCPYTRERGRRIMLCITGATRTSWRIDFSIPDLWEHSLKVLSVLLKRSCYSRVV